MTEQEIGGLLADAREAIASREEATSIEALLRLAPVYDCVKPVDAVDLLERCCVFGSAATVAAAYEAFPEFVYEGWALALALRCANEPVARLLLDRGVDLLGAVHPPTTYRALLPYEATFTRFDLTRKSPTLFVNPMDPTVSTEVFEPFRGRANESLAAPAYAAPTDLEATCDLIVDLAGEGAFDPVVYDDLLRAGLVRAWHALRHVDQQDERTADICLSFGARMLSQYHMRGQGDQYRSLILGSLIVPKVHPRIVAFVCEHAPDVFLERLCTLTWLQREVDLVASMVPLLSAGTEEQNGRLLSLLAENGRMDQLMMLEDWPRTYTTDNVDAAMVAASHAGHGEAAAWLLARRPSPTSSCADNDPLGLLL